MGGGTPKWVEALKKMGFSCTSFSRETPPNLSPRIISSSVTSVMGENAEKVSEEEAEQNGLASKALCAICLDHLTTIAPAAAVRDNNHSIFTAECGHAFHFPCIASNVRHGSVTCPICRAVWSHLPRPAAASTPSDPILRILEDSIASSRTTRRSLRSSSRLYDDDDPLDPPNSPSPRLHLSLSSSSSLSVRLSRHPSTDIVLVVTPNGPHLRLLKQAIALAVLSLSNSDRLAIVTYSAASASRAFPLRRMTSHGKRSALRVVDRLFYLGPSPDPAEGIQKGFKVLEDRAHGNPNSSILHLSDSPVGLGQFEMPVERFHVGYGFGASNGFVMHEFEEFLGRVVGGVIREAQLRVGESGNWVRLGEVRGGEERRVAVDCGRDCRGFVCVGYSYVEGGSEERVVTGEAVVGFKEKGDGGGSGGDRGVGRGRSGEVERWEYLDPFMARRWAKHLHGCRV